MASVESSLDDLAAQVLSDLDGIVAGFEDGGSPGAGTWTGAKLGGGGASDSDDDSLGREEARAHNVTFNEQLRRENLRGSPRKELLVRALAREQKGASSSPPRVLRGKPAASPLPQPAASSPRRGKPAASSPRVTTAERRKRRLRRFKQKDDGSEDSLSPDPRWPGGESGRPSPPPALSLDVALSSKSPNPKTLSLTLSTKP
mmetsp:Transcript_27075/g.85107  ORF Transcript_27075/g.85107 Transcript_27075/m.85107 type:complete len:202 (+) Transcript_27075:2319-2924(+)